MNERADISSFALKIIAIIGMTCNHTANVFAAIMPPLITLALYSLGGITFPIMAYLLVKGYSYTSDVKKYASRLLIFAVIAQIPYSLLWGATPNVLFTLLIGLGVLYANDHLESRRAFLALLIAAILGTICFDWGSVGIIVIYCFAELSGTKNEIFLTLLIPFALTFIPSCIELVGLIGIQPTGYALAETGQSIFTAEALAATSTNTLADAGPIICALGQIGYSIIGFGLAWAALQHHQGRRGRPLKYFFYIFYPAHLAIIWSLKCLLLTV